MCYSYLPTLSCFSAICEHFPKFNELQEGLYVLKLEKKQRVILSGAEKGSTVTFSVKKEQS